MHHSLRLSLAGGLCALGLMGCFPGGGDRDRASRGGGGGDGGYRGDRRIGDRDRDHDRYGGDRDQDRYGTTQQEIGYSNAEEQFLADMTSRHLASLQLLDVAQGKAHHQELRDLIETMRDKQQGELDQMRQMRREADPTRPDQPSPISQGELTRLKNHRPGPTFDLVFIDAMMPLQEEAIRLSKEYQDRAEDDRAKSFARGIQQENRYELGQLQQWKEAWSRERGDWGHDRR